VSCSIRFGPHAVGRDCLPTWGHDGPPAGERSTSVEQVVPIRVKSRFISPRAFDRRIGRRTTAAFQGHGRVPFRVRFLGKCGESVSAGDLCWPSSPTGVDHPIPSATRKQVPAAGFHSSRSEAHQDGVTDPDYCGGETPMSVESGNIRLSAPRAFPSPSAIIVRARPETLSRIRRPADPFGTLASCQFLRRFLPGWQDYTAFPRRK